MKKALGMLLLALACSLSAAPSLGVDFYLNVRDNGDTDADLEIIPSLILMPSSRFEVVPKAGFNVDMDEHGTEFGILGGCGFYFHLIESKPFVLSFGPDFFIPFGFGDDLFKSGIFMGAPVNVDLYLHRRFFLRAGLRVISFGIDITSQNDETDVHTDFTIDSVLEPLVAFYFEL
ncbi:MAG: hypothetical protein GF401_18530 [Chitinivibrionales bacterium]|nr:hypothetical protein [Chitinivibrionales bacterium]